MMNKRANRRNGILFNESRVDPDPIGIKYILIGMYLLFVRVFEICGIRDYEKGRKPSQCRMPLKREHKKFCFYLMLNKILNK